MAGGGGSVAAGSGVYGGGNSDAGTNADGYAGGSYGDADTGSNGGFTGGCGNGNSCAYARPVAQRYPKGGIARRDSFAHQYPTARTNQMSPVRQR